MELFRRLGVHVRHDTLQPDIPGCMQMGVDFDYSIPILVESHTFLCYSRVLGVFLGNGFVMLSTSCKDIRWGSVHTCSRDPNCCIVAS